MAFFYISIFVNTKHKCVVFTNIQYMSWFIMLEFAAMFQLKSLHHVSGCNTYNVGTSGVF